jgi:hypothetical protein
MPWVAFTKPFDGKQARFEEALFFKGFNGVV